MYSSSRVPPRARAVTDSRVNRRLLRVITPPRSRSSHRIRLPQVRLSASLGFNTARFQSQLSTRLNPSTRYRLPLSQQRLHHTPHSTLEGRRYTLKLYSDPRFPEVPPESDFSAPADAISGHHDSLRVWHTSRSFDTARGQDSIPAFALRQEHTTFPLCARVRVAQPHFKFISESDWVEGGNYNHQRPS